MSKEVHRFNVVKMLSEEGNKIDYKPHGPAVVLADAYDALLAERDAMKKDAERYRWLLRQAWFQSAFDRYDFDDGGMQIRFEQCAAEIIDAALQGEQP